MIKLTSNPITLYITPNFRIPNVVKHIGKTEAGFITKGFNLQGETGIKNRNYYTEELNANLGGIVVSKKKINMFHANSNSYADAERSKNNIFKLFTQKVTDIAKDTKEKVHVMLFGGYGYGCKKNVTEVQNSHNLFNNVALCVEDELPAKEGLNIPLTTIWGKKDVTKPDAVFVRENTVILINDIFKSLFKNGNKNPSRNEIVKFLEEHYEEVLIPDEVKIIATEKYEPYRGFLNKYKKKELNTSI